MGQFIIKGPGEDEYFIWSTVVDAPVSYMMTRAEVLEHLAYQDIMTAKAAADERVRRVDQTGTSLIDENPTLDPLRHVDYNRAGPGETQLSREALLEMLRHPPQDAV